VWVVLETPNVKTKPKQTPCSFGLSATCQHYFSLKTNQPSATSQQYFSLRTNQQQPSATSQPNRLKLKILELSKYLKHKGELKKESFRRNWF
jgi:uncharacterized lipoprotein YmbA